MSPNSSKGIERFLTTPVNSKIVAVLILSVLSMVASGFIVSVKATTFATPSAATVTSPTGFNGLNQTGVCGCNRPDVQVAAGPNHLMEVVNQAVAIYNKQGTQLNSVPLNTFFQRGTNFLDDSMVLYDNLSQRWFATTVDTSSGSVVAAVSSTTDPTQSWHFYTIGGTDILCYDRARIGVSSDKFVVTAWSFGSFYAPAGECAGSGGPQGEQYWVMKKSDMINGAANVNNITIGPTQYLGYGTQPMQAIGSVNTIYLENPISTGVYVIRIDGVPPGTVTNSTTTVVTSGGSPSPPTAPSPNNSVVDTLGRCSGSDCIDRVSWFNGRLWSAYTVGCTPPGDNTLRSCIQMLQLNTTSSNPTILQDFVVGVKGQYYFYPATSFDQTGNMDLLFGYSNSTTWPTLALSGQAWNDPANTVAPRLTIKQGSFCCPNNEWGDYMGAGLDPSNSTLVWTAGEIMPPQNPYPQPAWSTFIASEKLVPVPPDFSISVNPSIVSLTVLRAVSVTVTLTSLHQFAGSVTLSASGPGGVSTTFTVNPVSVAAGGSATSTLKITANTCNIGGNRVTVTGTSGSLTHSAQVTISRVNC